MKIDRLLAIITYLLNRDIITCKQLAEKFEVSERTIQRDVETINMAGIPITSIRGMHGGYKILDTYRLSKQTSSEHDLASVELALRSLASAIDDDKVSSTLEKVKSISSAQAKSRVNVDFGVAKENERVTCYINTIKEAIANKLKISFFYTNADGFTSSKFVEPVSLEFKWYAWYMIGYLSERDQYRVFKLLRMNDVEVSETHYINYHEKRDNLFDELISKDTRRSIDIVFSFNKSISTAIEEYMPGVRLSSIDKDTCKGELSAIENERMWFGFLLSFGDEITVLEPESLRERLVEHARKILKKYERG